MRTARCRIAAEMRLCTPGAGVCFFPRAAGRAFFRIRGFPRAGTREF
jgi:hypothetical protein